MPRGRSPDQAIDIASNCDSDGPQDASATLSAPRVPIHESTASMYNAPSTYTLTSLPVNIIVIVCHDVTGGKLVFAV